MPIAAGTKLCPYEIADQLGAGGMGEVYRATDTRLDRTVAIKVLPEHLADRADLRERFEREAKAVSSLNHPHICTLHDIGEQDGIHYLVMEYVDGETLQQRLEKGRLPLDQALEYAIQIADALDKAHRQGVVHRDLKPGNIMITKAGTKLLDFGLAKLKGDAGEVSPLSQMPTQDASAPLTAEGTIIGTLQYMAPEQLEGKEADARTDIFAFGAVVYEMVTGKKAFEGVSQASLITARMGSKPVPIADIQPVSPPMLDHVITACLAKNPEDRCQNAADLMRELKWVVEASSDSTAAPTGFGWRVHVAWALVVLIVAVASAVLFRPVPPTPETRLDVNLPSPNGPAAISPDGRKVVFSAKGQLWLRRLESDTAQPLAGTDGGGRPFWAPNSQSVGFFGQGQLKRIDLEDGGVQALTTVFSANGGTWNADGDILFARSSTGPLYRIRESGGDVTEVTRVAPPEEAGHRWPQFLPDGRRFIFFVLGPPGRRGVYLGSLDSPETQRLFDAESAAVFAPPDYLLFARRGALVAQRVDLESLEAVGDSFQVADRAVASGNGYFAPVVSASSSGQLAYRRSLGVRQLVWLDRAGRRIGTVGEADPAMDGFLALAPDGETVAVRLTVGGNTDIWRVGIERGIAQPLTTDPTPEAEAVFSADGSRVVFSSLRNGLPDLYEKPVDGTGNATVVYESSEFKNLNDWSPDGKYVLFTSQPPEAASRNLWAWPISGDGELIAVANTEFQEQNGRFSPDGRFVSYSSNETGRQELFVQRFPERGPRTAIGPARGHLWRSDGQELFYIAPDGYLKAVPINLDGEEAELAGEPVSLFPLPLIAGLDVSPDGQRFLVNMVIEEDSFLTLSFNWEPEEDR